MKVPALMAVLILSVLLISSSGQAMIAPVQDNASVAATIINGEERLAPYVFTQFQQIPEEGGVPFGFSYCTSKGCIGDDPQGCRHYQGVARKGDMYGDSYLFLTRSGNDTGTHCLPDGDFPGELLVVEFNSQNQMGEPFRTNRGDGDDPPPVDDRTVESINFDGVSDDNNGSIWPGWCHLGGIQLIGDILVVPTEAECLDWDKETDQCGSIDETKGSIVLVDVSDPLHPRLLKVIDAGIPVGVVAVTKDPESDSYLFALTGSAFAGDTQVGFYISNRITNWNDPEQVKNFGLTHLNTWDKSELGDDEGKWLHWQTLNFVRNTDGPLFLVGTGNTDPLLGTGDDYVRIFRVFPENNFQTSTDFQLLYYGEKHLYLNTPADMGNFNAVGGVYISPQGRLSLNTGGHDNTGEEVFGVNSYNMGQFTSDYGPFADAYVWNAPEHYETVQAFSHDGRSPFEYIIGRSDEGIRTWIFEPQLGLRQLSSEGPFEDPGWAYPDNYLTIQSGNITEEYGMNTILGRGGLGMEIWRWNGLDSWINVATVGPFADSSGWYVDDHYLTIQNGDIGATTPFEQNELIGRHSTGINTWRFYGGVWIMIDQSNPPWSDADGWDQPDNYQTIQLGNIIGEPYTELLGRGGAGMLVWQFDMGLDADGAWKILATSTAGRPFPDSTGWDNEIYYRTIQTADVDGDGTSEVLGRGGAGIQVWKFLPDGAGGYVWSQLSSSGPCSDANGWGYADNYLTIQFADIDGDGKEELLGRGDSGMVVWEFVPSSNQWVQLDTGGPFSDQEGFNYANKFMTIQTADVNGDGRADLLGRGTYGVNVYTWNIYYRQWEPLLDYSFRGSHIALPLVMK